MVKHKEPNSGQMLEFVSSQTCIATDQADTANPRRRKGKKPTEKRMDHKVQEAPQAHPTELSVHIHWEDGDVTIEPVDGVELNDEIVEAIDSVRRALLVGASLIDTAGRPFRVTINSRQDDLERLSEVISARAGVIVRIAKL